MTGPLGYPQPMVQRRFKVGDAEIRPDTNTIAIAGEERYLRLQAMQVLTYFLQRPGELVSKEELNRAIWNDTAVTDDALVQCVVEIRRALGDDPKRPRFVRTVPKGGYCFIGPVSDFPEPPVPSPEAVAAVDPARFGSSWRTWAAAAVAVAILSGVALVSNWPRGSVAGAAIGFPAEPGKTRVIVLAFDNTAKNDDLNWLQRGLAEMIVTDLARSPSLNVLAPAQLARLDGGDAVDVAGAIDLARRTAADAIITGAFSSVGEALRVDARVYRADGTLLGSQSLTAGRREAVLAEVDRLAEGLTRILGRPLNEREATSRLSDVMTADLSAYREYSLGVEKGTALQWNAALKHFENAIRADANFAMAHARIGYTYAVTMGWPSRGEGYLAKAFQLSDRLREADRLSILAWYALAKLDFESALTPLRTLVARYPDDIENYWLLSRTLRGEERFDEALAVVTAGLRVNPNAKDLYNELYGLHGTAGRMQSALDAAKKYLELSPQEPNAHDSVGLAYQQAGRYADAIAHYEKAIALDPSFDIPVIHLANTFVEQGRYRDAEKMYARHVAMMTIDEMRQRGIVAQAWIHFYRGDLGRAYRQATSTNGEPETPRYDVAILALANGDRRRFDAELKKKVTSSNRGARSPQMLIHYLHGLEAQADGNQQGAIEAFRQAIRHPPMPWAIPSFDDCLAQAYFDYGRWSEAEAEYSRLLLRNQNAARYHYRLAQIADRTGRPADAAKSYRRVLGIWATADADVPEIVNARAWLKHAERNAAADSARLIAR